MTTTLSNIIDEVLLNLAGYTYQQDRTTYISSAVSTTTQTSLSLGSTENIGKGIIEIDEELMWIDTFDRVVNTATVAPYGRGYLGTTPTAHSVNSKVTIAPTFPRFSVKKAINDTIRAVGSSIFAVGTTTLTYNAAYNTYDFDGLDIQNILDMSWESVGPSREWIPIRRWRFDSVGDSTTFGAGSQTVTIYDAITAGRTIKVIYSKDPTAFTADNQVFTTQTGLPESCKDVVVLGAAYRLLAFLDPARTGQVSPQADETDSKRPFGTSINSTRQLLALYTQRLAEESQRQQNFYKIRVHYTR
jgi:hypothetical protein